MVLLTQLTDEELVSNFSNLVIEERERLVLQLEYIQELERRKLFFEYSSLWAYLVSEKGMDESGAERRIRAARWMKKLPELKGLLESGKMNLSLLEIALSCAYREKLSEEELWEVIQRISGMSCRKAKREIANLYPQTVEIPSDRVKPFHSGYSEVTFYANEELMNQLEQIRGVLAHSHPHLQMRELIAILASDYYDRHHPEAKARRAAEREAKKMASQNAEQPSAPKAKHERSFLPPLRGAEPTMGEEAKHERSFLPPLRGAEPTMGEEAKQETTDIVVEKREYSQAIVHAMVLQDGYICSYVDPITGKSCESQWGLDKHHLKSWHAGGPTSLKNSKFMCKNHHARMTFLEFGGSSHYQKKFKKK